MVEVPSNLSYALLGHPVGHSLSPAMHQAAFRTLGLPFSYQLIDVPPGAFRDTFRALAAAGLRGANITLPHKQTAYRFLARSGTLTRSAQILKAVNTVTLRRDGSWLGDNTDAPGFFAALRETFHASPRGKHVMVLGIGGAGRALALACLFQGAASLRIVARKPDARRRWMHELRRAAPGLPMAGFSFVDAPREAPACDLLIQATPVGMRPGDPSLLPATAFRRGQMVVDLVYRPAQTPFLAAAAAAGARVSNGLGMLLHQGALAFRLWTRRPAPMDAMRAALLHACPPEAHP